MVYEHSRKFAPAGALTAVLAVFAVFAVFAVLIAIILSTSVEKAWADHEPNHRYAVEGVVLDADGRPFPNEDVVVTDVNMDLSANTKTDRNGRYRAQLHLHDENVGDELTISAAGATRTVKVAFDPANHTKERVQKVNLTVNDKKAPAQKDSGYSTYYIALGVVVLLAGAVAVTRRRKSTKIAKARSPHQPKKGGKKSKKKKR